MNTYELMKELAIVERELEEIDIFEDEAAGALIERLTSLEVEAKQKVYGVANWIRNLEGQEEALASEIKRLQGRKSSNEKLQSGLRKFMIACMSALDLKKLKNEFHTISLLAPKERVVVDESKVLEWDAATFDAAIKSGALKEVYSVNKTELKKIDGWEKLPGVSVLEGETSLRIG